MKTIATTSPIPNCSTIKENINFLNQVIVGINNLIKGESPALIKAEYDLYVAKQNLAKLIKGIQDTQVAINAHYALCKRLEEDCLLYCRLIPKFCTPLFRMNCHKEYIRCVVPSFYSPLSTFVLTQRLVSYNRLLPSYNLLVVMAQNALTPVKKRIQSFITELSAKQKELKTQRDYCKIKSCGSCAATLQMNKNARKNIRRKS